jgi:hypothetical protein
MAEQFPVEPTSADPSGPESPRTLTTSERPWWAVYLPVAFVCCAFLAIGSSVIFVLTADPTPPVEPGPDPPGPEPKPDDIPTDIKAAEIEKLRADEEQNIRLANLERFTGPRDQAERHVQQLTVEMSRWETFIKDLLDGGSGRQIASDSSYVEHFLPIYERKQVTQEDVERFQRRMARLSAPVTAAEKDDSGYLPSDSLLADLKTLQDEVTAALQTLKDSRKEAEAIQRFAADRPAAETTLRTAIEAFREQQRGIRRERVAAAGRKTEADITAKLVEKETEKKQLLGELELAQKAKENAKLKATKRELDEAATAAAEEARRAAELAQLEREFERDLPQIRSLLRPFITSGMTQPEGRQFVTADQEGPVSLASLRRTGALEPTAKGRDLLFWITSANQLNDRDLGAFPDYRTGVYDKPRSLAVVKQAQDLLIKYGDLMVTKEMLAK